MGSVERQRMGSAAEIDVVRAIVSRVARESARQVDLLEVAIARTRELQSVGRERRILSEPLPAPQRPPAPELPVVPKRVHGAGAAAPPPALPIPRRADARPMAASPPGLTSAQAPAIDAGPAELANQRRGRGARRASMHDSPLADLFGVPGTRSSAHTD